MTLQGTTIPSGRGGGRGVRTRYPELMWLSLSVEGQGAQSQTSTWLLYVLYQTQFEYKLMQPHNYLSFQRILCPVHILPVEHFRQLVKLLSCTWELKSVRAIKKMLQRSLSPISWHGLPIFKIAIVPSYNLMQRCPYLKGAKILNNI